MKTYTLKVSEDELKALILHHNGVIFHTPFDKKVKLETSERLHNLVKRLHKDTPDIEEVKQPETFKQEPVSGLAQFEALKPAPKAGW